LLFYKGKQTAKELVQ